MRSRSICSAVFAVLLLISQSAIAVEFGPNSANITNPYMPFKVGTWTFSQGFGTTWLNRIFYLHVIGTETVSGAKIGDQVFNNVKSLKAHVIVTDDGGDYEHEFLTFSMAQDTDGNVWVLKIYQHLGNITGLLGGEYFKSMFMPAVPAVGLPAGIKMPEDAQNYCRIVQVGISSLITTFGTYEDCFKVNCYDEDPEDTEVGYYCRGFGTVRTTMEANPGDFMDLKEIGTSSLTRTVLIPLSD